jgi:UDP:flavonoid glycosyltransferase YjiC (YdhE family)
MVLAQQMAEQAVTARRVERHGLGLALEKAEITAQSPQDAVNQVAADHAMQARVRRLQGTIRQMGGAQAAADAVIAYSGVRKRWTGVHTPKSPSLERSRETSFHSRRRRGLSRLV